MVCANVACVDVSDVHVSDVDMTGIEMGPNMEEALRRMESGEDPEQVEAEMGDLLEDEEPFMMPGKKGGRGSRKTRPAPKKDDTLYDL